MSLSAKVIAISINVIPTISFFFGHIKCGPNGLEVFLAFRPSQNFVRLHFEWGEHLVITVFVIKLEVAVNFLSLKELCCLGQGSLGSFTFLPLPTSWDHVVTLMDLKARNRYVGYNLVLDFQQIMQNISFSSRKFKIIKAFALHQARKFGRHYFSSCFTNSKS